MRSSYSILPEGDRSHGKSVDTMTLRGRFSSGLSAEVSINPATSGYSGSRGIRRAIGSMFAWERSFPSVSLGVPCWFAISGHRTSQFHKTHISHQNYARTQEVSQVRFSGRSMPISSASFWPSSVPTHIYQMNGCSAGFSVTPGHPCIQINCQLVDSSPVKGTSSTASRCCARSHKGFGTQVEPDEECAFSTTENHFSRRSVGFVYNASTSVSCMCLFHPNHSERNIMLGQQLSNLQVGS